MKKQHIVLEGFNFGGKKDLDDINTFFAEKKWGKVTFVLKIKTLAGYGGEGGRIDSVFEWDGTDAEMGKLAISRFQLSNPPRWLEDYLNNNKEIIPEDMESKLKILKAW